MLSFLMVKIFRRRYWRRHWRQYWRRDWAGFARSYIGRTWRGLVTFQFFHATRRTSLGIAEFRLTASNRIFVQCYSLQLLMKINDYFFDHGVVPLFYKNKLGKNTVPDKHTDSHTHLQDGYLWCFTIDQSHILIWMIFHRLKKKNHTRKCICKICMKSS